MKNRKIVTIIFILFFPTGLVERGQAKKVSVNFMVKHPKKNNLFLWPPKSDVQSVGREDILMKLSQPPQPVDRTLFTIPESNAVNTLFENQVSSSTHVQTICILLLH